jgi:hypothetical protein
MRALALVFSALSIPFAMAHADFALVTYETTTFPDEACTENMKYSDYTDANMLIENHAKSFNLMTYARYFIGSGTCSWKTNRTFKIEKLVQGSASDVAKLVANPPTFKGKYLSFTFQVTPYTKMISHYYLNNLEKTPLQDILTRNVADMQEEFTGFVSHVCHNNSQREMLEAVKGTPKEQQVQDYLTRFHPFWFLGYDAILKSAAGQDLPLAGGLWGCYWPF